RPRSPDAPACTQCTTNHSSRSAESVRDRRHGLAGPREAAALLVPYVPNTYGQHGLDHRRRCPGWDSNPHWTVFETAFSADWNTGASQVEKVADGFRAARIR